VAITVLGEIQGDLINVAPSPAFPALERTHDGVPCPVKMLGGVFVFGRIAAAHVTTNQAQTKMDPAVPRFEAFLTT